MLRSALENRLVRTLARRADTRAFPMAVASVSRLPVAEVVPALWVGKLASYLVYAGLAAASPSLWLARARGRLTTLNAVLERAGREPPRSGVP